MSRFVRVIVLILAGSIVRAAGVHACDVCAIYTATELRESRTGWRVGVGEQFTHFDRLQDDGERIDGGGQYLDSSITQLLLGYDFTPRLGVQLTLPIIDRRFRRVEDDRLQRGHVNGIGDLALVGMFRPYSLVTENLLVRTTLLGGLKFPTGSSHRLKEETEDGHHDEVAEGEPDDHGDHDHSDEHEDALPANGIHGHDLALGSGSVDGVVGGSDLTGDLPVSRHNTGVQIVPSYRIRGGVAWRF